jgi:CheY-like chemotaxis protein
VSHPTIEPLRHQPSPQTILCVEDNPAYLRLRKAVLEGEGYLVFSAATGSRAIALMQRLPVSLVLSDHMLRGTTGVALAQQLKAIKPHVPFVLYSGTVPEVMGDVDCFISKDETVPKFLSIIKSLIKRYEE